ncbi:hypothetical protein AB0B44_27885, partial [Streptomyces sp. NPDC041003]
QQSDASAPLIDGLSFSVDPHTCGLCPNRATTGSGERGRRTGGGAPSGGAAAASARSRVGSGGQGRRRAV